jgi:hypothetical protein
VQGAFKGIQVAAMVPGGQIPLDVGRSKDNEKPGREDERQTEVFDRE